MNPAGEASPGDGFMLLLTSHQRMLHAYIITLLGNTQAAQDVLQNVNLKVWQKAEQYDPERSFGAWARGIAYRTVQEHWRKEQGERNLKARLRLAERLNERFREEDPVMEERYAALDYCLSLLPDHHRRWIERRYREGKSVSAIADEKNASSASIAQALYRVRQTLKKCVERRLKLAEQGGL